jgi:hypothetical protein
MPTTNDGFIRQGGRVTGGKCKTRQKVMMLKGNAVLYQVAFSSIPIDTV